MFKALRTVFLLFVFPIVTKYASKKKFGKEKFFFSVMLCGIISGVLGIVLFLTQTELYSAGQTMEFMGRVMYRAGGIFAEAGTFALMMAITLLFAIECLKAKMHVKLSLLTIVVSAVAIVVSDTRIALLSVAAVTVYAFLAEKRLTAKQLGLMAVAVLVCVLVYGSSSFVQRFINERVLATLSGLFSKSSTVNEISSGRIEIWTDRLKNYASGNALQIIFGNGYKVNDGEAALSDNNYISALYYTGILGFVSFAGYWISNLRMLKRSKRKQDLIDKIYRNTTLLLLLYMVTCDAMTMFRPMYLYAAIAAFYYCRLQRKNGGEA
jgi:hypothetical protein